MSSFIQRPLAAIMPGGLPPVALNTPPSRIGTGFSAAPVRAAMPFSRCHAR